MSIDPSPVEKALDTNDAQALAKHATMDELQRLRAAEEVLQLVNDRMRNTRRLAVLSQVMVGVVAALGMLVNAFQSYSSRSQQQHQAEIDEERWSREFTRAQRADKYRAFFETSVLATDPSNPDKRLVGYALLQEFVSDEDYNAKATLMLEESLAQELRGAGGSVEAAHRNAVVAIVSALSQTNDCHALERAARSVEKVAQHHKDEQDVEETRDLFRLYVRRLMGRAALTCKTMQDFTEVRRPLADTLGRLPELTGAAGKLKPEEIDQQLVQLLVESCRDEVEVSSASDCVATLEHYATLCAQPAKPAQQAVEAPGCALAKASAAELKEPK